MANTPASVLQAKPRGRPGTPGRRSENFSGYHLLNRIESNAREARERIEKLQLEAKVVRLVFQFHYRDKLSCSKISSMLKDMPEPDLYRSRQQVWHILNGVE